MNIVLIGYRGSGKSAVGQKLASRLAKRFVDTDDLIIEREAAPIDHIVNSGGWAYFRRLEKSVIEEVSKEDDLVIASGGGAVLDAENVEALRKNGVVIWLKAHHEILLERINQDPETSIRRPSLTSGTKAGRESGLLSELLEEIKEVLSVRQPFYKKASEVEVDTSSLDIDAVVERIVELLKKR
jgi:shikimate kinase